MDLRTDAVWHHETSAQAVANLASDASAGLSDGEVQARRERFGPNAVTMRHGHGPLVRFLLEFHQPLIYILLAATIVTLALQEWIDAAVIFGVVLINAIVGFVQESKALKAIDALAKTLTTEANVIRGGRKMRVKSPDIVPGDIVLIQSGDKTPADLRLLKCRDLQVAEAALTGESVPVQKAIDSLPAETVLADRRNMVFASTLVTYGQGTGVVVATGDNTEVGRISEMIATADNLATPLTRRIAQFSKVLLFVILGLAAMNFVIGAARGQSFVEIFMASVALAVAAIPEGLPAAVTIALAIGVGRMARRKAIIRKLPAVETLGSTTVICSDKTGTLTENQMTVTAIVAGGERFGVSGVGYSPRGDFAAVDANDEDSKLTADQVRERTTLFECLRAGLLCNDSRLIEVDGRWEIHGDPTEGALLVSARKAGLDPDGMYREWPRLDGIPFESEHQYMATLHDAGAGRPRIVYLKGSVEKTLARCVDTLDARGERQPLDGGAIHAAVEALASEGLRVLALATKSMSAESSILRHEDVSEGMTFLGLQAMIDPPRAEAIAAVKTCHAAGIRVKMITGDHALTASAIARQIGIGALDPKRDPNQAKVATGQELSNTSDADLGRLVDRISVFARVAPEQKLRLVRALQNRGHIVAMTGDGVNDAPALKQADIGIAMGITGTDVAKEAADMVLTDDNFASIEAAVEEGRGVFDNLTKFIVWTLPTNVGEGLVILTAVLLGANLPISPVQILWINMMTAIFLGLMLAFEPNEPGIMDREPRDPRAPILRRPLIMRVGLVSLLLLFGAYGLFAWMERDDSVGLEAAQTVAVNVIVFGELFYVFNCRSLTKTMFHIGVWSNPAVIAGALVMTMLQLALTYVPFMNTLFNTAPIGTTEWAAIIGFGMILYLIVETEKSLVGHTLLGDAVHTETDE